MHNGPIEWLQSHEKLRQALVFMLLLVVIAGVAYWVFALPIVTPPSPLPPDITSISYARTQCLGKCPVFQMSITATYDDDALIQFEGQRYTCAKNVETATMRHTDLLTLTHFIEMHGFFELVCCISYAIVSDSPGVIIDASINGKRNRVSSSYGETQITPANFVSIVKEIDAIANQYGWVTGCPEEERTRANP